MYTWSLADGGSPIGDRYLDEETWNVACGIASLLPDPSNPHEKLPYCMTIRLPEIFRMFASGTFTKILWITLSVENSYVALKRNEE
jgi:hypothetical protein